MAAPDGVFEQRGSDRTQRLRTRTSSSDSSRARIARATRAATRGAFSVALRESESSAVSRLIAWSALTGSASAPWSRSPASTSSMHIASRLGFGPAAVAKASSARASPESACASSVSPACKASSASAAEEPHCPSARPTDTAERRASACSQQRARAPSAIIGSAVASCKRTSGRSMTSAHHAANGPSRKRTSSTSPSAVPRGSWLGEAPRRAC